MLYSSSSDSENDMLPAQNNMMHQRPNGLQPGRPNNAPVDPGNGEGETTTPDPRKLLEEMFPLVCRDWIRNSLESYSVEQVIQYVLQHEKDPAKVPKMVKKRRRMSQLENPANKTPSPLFRHNVDAFANDASEQFKARWCTMSLAERFQHSEMVSMLLSCLDHVPSHLSSNCQLPFDGVSFLQRAYPKVKSTFVRELCNYSRVALYSCIVILELLQAGHERRLYEQQVFLDIVSYAKKRGAGMLRPHTSRHFEMTSRSKTNPFPNNSKYKEAAAAWDAVNSVLIEQISLEKFTCQICFEDLPVLDGIECSSQQEGGEAHRFCFDCIGGQAKACCEEGRVVEGGSGIPCPAIDCKAHVTTGDLRVARVEKRIIVTLEKRLEQEVLSAAGIPIERCKYCSFGAYFETSADVNKVFSCINCTAEFCRLCLKDWEHHIGRRCEEMVTLEEEARKKLEDELTAAVIHTCPRCSLSFEKETGCNKMTCRCGLSMCYVCRATDIDYSHFCGHFRDIGSSGCPLKCPKKCLLWQDVDKTLKNNRRRLLQRAAEQGAVHENLIRALAEK